MNEIDVMLDDVGGQFIDQKQVKAVRVAGLIAESKAAIDHAAEEDHRVAIITLSHRSLPKRTHERHRNEANKELLVSKDARSFLRNDCFNLNRDRPVFTTLFGRLGLGGRGPLLRRGARSGVPVT